MSLQLTQKEKLLLEDQKSQEELCIKKYNDYANKAQGTELKQLFQQLAQQEQQHLDTVNQILNGQVPNMQNQQSGGQGQSAQQSSMQSGQSSGQQSQGMKKIKGTTFNNTVGTTPEPVTTETSFVSNSTQDKDLCQDMLTTEKHVSSTYDTTIFEFTNTQVREALNHIQKEEQQHGEQIFNYMNQNGMYNPQ